MTMLSKILEAINQMSYGEERMLKRDHAAYKETMTTLIEIRDKGIDLKNNFYLVIEPDKFTKFEPEVFNYINAIEKKLNEKGGGFGR